MVVIANDWTTKIVWAQLDTLLSCPPFWDAPEPPPSEALIQRPRRLDFIHSYPLNRPSYPMDTFGIPVDPPLPTDGSVQRYGLTALGQWYLEALENPAAAYGAGLLMALKHPEIESAEALAIYYAVPTWKKVLGWFQIVGVHIALRKQWLRHHAGRLGEHLVYGIILDGIFYAITGHEAAWLVIQTIAHLKKGHE